MFALISGHVRVGFSVYFMLCGTGYKKSWAATDLPQAIAMFILKVHSQLCCELVICQSVLTQTQDQTYPGYFLL